MGRNSVMQILVGTMLAGALLFGVFSGRGDAVFEGILQGASGAVGVVMELMGSFAIFCGLMNILSHGGGVEFVNRRLKRPLKWLIPGADEEALSFVTGNLAANMLGLGNAATPLGMEAAKRLAKGEKATAALSMFLVINASSVQLIPSTVVAMRTAAGARDPGAVILPAFLATTLSTLTGILLCKWRERKR